MRERSSHRPRERVKGEPDRPPREGVSGGSGRGSGGSAGAPPPPRVFHRSVHRSVHRVFHRTAGESRRGASFPQAVDNQSFPQVFPQVVDNPGKPRNPKATPGPSHGGTLSAKTPLWCPYGVPTRRGAHPSDDRVDPSRLADPDRTNRSASSRRGYPTHSLGHPEGIHGPSGSDRPVPPCGRDWSAVPGYPQGAVDRVWTTRRAGCGKACGQRGVGLWTTGTPQGTGRRAPHRAAQGRRAAVRYHRAHRPPQGLTGPHRGLTGHHVARRAGRARWQGRQGPKTAKGPP